MFDNEAVGRFVEAVDALCEQPVALADGAQVRRLLRVLQGGSDRLDGLKAAALDALEETRAFADDGASSSLSWARRELRLSDAEIKKRRAAGRSMRLLPGVAEALFAGDVRLEHVYELTAGITKVGQEHMVEATASTLLSLARVATPKDVAAAVTRLAEVVHPERLDEHYRRGMDKHDVAVTRCGDGYHLSGFLDVVNGAKLATWLTAASAPLGAEDVRAPAQRRVDAFGGIVDAVLRHGMPSDRGARPQLHVMVDATWLASQGAGQDGDAGSPGGKRRGRGGAVGLPGAPTLVGFGTIGPELFGYLGCEADVTAILVDGVTGGPTPQADVLNVGRTVRLATAKQRAAVLARQAGVCGAPGCRHRIAEIHHVAWWARDGGRTDLDELVGLCGRCHTAVHSGRLRVAGDGKRGFVFGRRGERLRPRGPRAGAGASTRRLPPRPRSGPAPAAPRSGQGRGRSVRARTGAATRIRTGGAATTSARTRTGAATTDTTRRRRAVPRPDASGLRPGRLVAEAGVGSPPRCDGRHVARVTLGETVLTGSLLAPGGAAVL
ncbi:HNH endonuclease [Mumia sp. DW29H23]|uniref:HNH endonuclease signature motif containing protein n=1 Tax=Mumia sp. DW29H23 TaxID=3421241 RepID=UPI003D689FFC